MSMSDGSHELTCNGSYEFVVAHVFVSSPCVRECSLACERVVNARLTRDRQIEYRAPYACIVLVDTCPLTLPKNEPMARLSQSSLLHDAFHGSRRSSAPMMFVLLLVFHLL